MIIQRIWYQTVKLFLKVSLHYYTNRIKISGRENIPKKGAVLFAVNHPNALMDPLFVTSFNPRTNHFLVRADVFKKPLIKKALGTLNLMPIYRIRDGRKQLANNEEIFNKCFNILKNKETLIIFPQGGHCRDRTIQPLSKGFTRIVFGALETDKNLNIDVIPVGITYQNSSTYPCKVAVKYGKPIDSRKVFEENNTVNATAILKDKVSNQLKELTVHISKDENYQSTLQQLNDANVDFTEVDKVNKMIVNSNFPKKKDKSVYFIKPIFYIIILNSLLPYLFWKKNQKGIKEQEFVDTFRFGLNVITFPISYFLQAYILSFFASSSIVYMYLVLSFLLVFCYTKLTHRPTGN